MLNLPSYAVALRCIGQELQKQNIEIFGLETDDQEFRVQCGDPNPPYTRLIQLHFSPERIIMLDREGQERRRQVNSEFRFDSLPETLRAVGEYIDADRGKLRRLDNSSLSDQNQLEIAYETRDRELRTATLPMSFIRASAVNMYKRRSRLSHPIGMVTR
jgi:hypothetical protein